MYFKASLVLTLLAIMVLALLLNLGVWQLDRAQQKQDLLDLQADRITQTPVDISSIDMMANNLRYLPIKLSGQYDHQHQLLIDNQVKSGQAGYFVLTPIKLDDGRAILVNRGWLNLGVSRDKLPDVKVAPGQVFVSGKLDHFPSVGIKLEGADELTAGWPAVTQVVDVDKVARRLGYAVLPYQVLLNSDEEEGYDRDWVPMKMGPEKHHGYAFQWFALAAAWVVIYFVLTIKRRNNEYTDKE
jgi:surfeit locus 1 family protein